nr:hypothetical protein [Tanacetum cinerariifolium]
MGESATSNAPLRSFISTKHTPSWWLGGGGCDEDGGGGSVMGDDGVRVVVLVWRGRRRLGDGDSGVEMMMMV